MKAQTKYQRFILENSATISTIESTLRSISYIIPGRFSDSEFAAEALYSMLNLIRMVHEGAFTSNGQVLGDGISKGAWNEYLTYLRRQSKLLNCVMTFLNVTWTVEVPLEMLIHRLLGLAAKLRASCKLIVFFTSNWRPVLRHFLPSIAIETYSKGRIQDENKICDLISEIDLAEGKEEDGIKNFLKKHRIDKYMLVPELSMTPRRDLLGKLREFAHILRPLIYATTLSLTVRDSERNRKIKWISWIITLGMDIFSEWPSLMSLVSDKKSESISSNIEKDEYQIRSIKMLLYLIREPFFGNATKPYADSVMNTLGSWKILQPIIDTARSYEKLCEKVVYYTLGS